MCCFVSVVHHMKASVLEGLLYLTSFFSHMLYWQTEALEN